MAETFQQKTMKMNLVYGSFMIADHKNNPDSSHDVY